MAPHDGLNCDPEQCLGEINRLRRALEGLVLMNTGLVISDDVTLTVSIKSWDAAHLALRNESATLAEQEEGK